MKFRAYGIYDDALKAFLPPYFARSEGEAKRMFMSAVRDRNGQFLAHAHDYALFHLGYFHDDSGLLEPTSQPGRVMTGLEATADPITGSPG